MTMPGSFRPQLDAAVADVAMQVNRETVLQARAALLAEADRLDRAVHDALSGWQGVGRCGGDPVSADAATAFTERALVLMRSCLVYNEDLRQVAYLLDVTAQAYGYTDDEIATSFQSGP